MRIKDGLLRLGAALCSVLALLGGWVRRFSGLSWQVPGWLRAIVQAGQGLGQRAAQRPLASSLGLLLLVALGVVGWQGWQWYRSLPQPYKVDYDWQAPGLTDYREKEPLADSLLIDFETSVAPLQAIGQPVSAGIEMRPAQAGTWYWSSDRRLSFEPKGDWPVGQRFQVRLAEQGLFAEGVLLPRYGFDFDTQAFSVSLLDNELYQDPVDADLRKLVATFGFSHPVDRTSFGKRVSVTLGKGLQYRTPGTANSPEVSFDAKGLKAFVHSAALAIPLENSEAGVRIDKGVKADAGGSGTPDALQGQLTIPGRYRLTFNKARVRFVDNQQEQPEPVLMFHSSRPVSDEGLAGHVQAWLLPEREQPWRSDELSAELMASAEPIALHQVPSAEPLNREHAFSFKAPGQRYLVVRVSDKVQAIGGYLTREPTYTLLQMPDYPRLLRFLADGALLSLRGEQRLGFMARGVPGVQVEIARLLPEQLHHLVDQNDGSLARPYVSDRYFDRLVERETRQIALPSADPAHTRYDTLDLAPYLRHDGGRKGLFVLRLSASDDPAERTFGYGDEEGDLRFVMVTDLGLIAKRSVEGGHEVFVQSIASGEPVAGARVRMIGRNGQTIAEQQTDAQGHVQFASLDELRRERAPLMVVASLGDDLSFLPLARYDQRLDFSRFDIGGVSEDDNGTRLKAYLFSDRGLYRPGETAHLGTIVRRNDWQGNLHGLPMEWQVTDPRGVTLLERRIRLSESGFESLDFTSAETAPAGTYMASLSLVGRDQQRVTLGSVAFNVREFEADRMKVNLSLAEHTPKGWLLPSQVQARVSARHLFGGMASGRRVGAELELSPAFADFPQYPGYRFQLPAGLEESSRESLAEQQTDEHGEALLDLGLQRFAASTYRLQLLARVFEAEGGRNVAAQSSLLVSSAPWLVGVRALDSLAFINKDAPRRIRWQAVDPDLQPRAVADLRTRLVERQHVSVLVKQPDSTYRYESRVKEVPRSAQVLELAEGGTEQLLDTSTPGDYSVWLEDAQGRRLNQIDYRVAGQGNVSRNLDRNAELQLQLDKRSYRAGEEIQVAIRAPYTGAGLITIERDRVYARHWFKTDSTSSVQRIRLPEGLEGNAYVNVQFVRDPASDEVYMSPLSYGVAPFSIDLEARRLPLTLQVPEQMEPGQTLSLTLDSPRPARALVFAVDEGILQVARYSSPDPLGLFFRKRAMEVDTRQILDLILPEFTQLMHSAAPGGDGEGALASHLNPFKRKRQPAVAWWSGLVDLAAGKQSLEYPVPEGFNGRLRVFAVAVDADSVGVAEGAVEVRGPLVVTPNLPAFVAPGDRFEVSAGVYSNLEQAATLSYRLESSAGLVLQSHEGSLALQPGQEQTVQVSVQASEVLGSAELRWVFSLADGREVRASESLSVRPAVARRLSLTLGRFDAERYTLKPTRQLFAEQRRVELALDASPLAWSQGLQQYLDDYAYSCTEQLLSKAMPGVLLNQDAKALEQAVDMLRLRQSASGGFALWSSNLQASTFATLYATDFLLEAREQGLGIPADLLQQANAYLGQVASGPSEGLGQLRERAYAAYLLSRQGTLVSGALADIQERLQTYHPKTWQQDLASAYLAASYKLLRQDELAEQLLRQVPWRSLDDAWQRSGVYYDPLIHDAERLTLLSRHFPQQLGQVPDRLLERLGQHLAAQRYNSLSAALLLRGFQQYGKQAGTAQSLSVSALQGQLREQLSLSGVPPRTAVPYATEQLALQRQGSGAAFFALSESGFDRAKVEALSQGLEISREYLDLQGQALSRVRVGEEFLVRLRLRAVAQERVSQVAVVDLLPGGVEPVLRAAVEAEQELDEEETAAVLGEAALSDWQPEALDVRDDRVVLYGDLTRDASTFVYRVRATNAGHFTTAPTFAEGLYDTDLQVRGEPGSLQIEAP